jgi:hypothetical protein
MTAPLDISHPDIRVKQGTVCAFTSIAVTLCANVFIYKTEIFIKNMYRNKVQFMIYYSILLVKRVYLHFKLHFK